MSTTDDIVKTSELLHRIGTAALTAIAIACGLATLAAAVAIVVEAIR